MTLNFILGDTTKNHQLSLVEKIKQISSQGNAEQVFLIVPDHTKFEAEIEILKALKQEDSQPVFAQNNVQIFSFGRLAWYYMRDTAVYQRTQISNAGLDMLLYKIVQTHKNELFLYQTVSNQTGFLEQIRDQIFALKNGNITISDLDNLLVNLDESTETWKKIHDLKIIGAEFLSATSEKYILSSDYIRLLLVNLTRRDLSHTHFILSGFDKLSAQELILVENLMKTAADLTVDLILPKPTREIPEKYDLFYRPGKLYALLYQFARNNEIQIGMDQYAKPKEKNEIIEEISNFWPTFSNDKNENFDLKGNREDSVQFLRPASFHTELRTVARRIHALVSSSDIRYRDILVLTPNTEDYANILRPVFQDFDIPYFEDSRQSMIDHPFVELIQSLAAIQKYKYRYQDVMRLLRTELLIPKQNNSFMNISDYRAAVDETENLILKNGYRAKDWLDENDWQAYHVDFDENSLASEYNEKTSKIVNVIHHFIRNILPPLFKHLQNAKDGREAATAIFQFLVNNGVDVQLSLWRDQAIEKGDIRHSQQPEQVWHEWIQMLDEFVELLGTEQFNIDDFMRLIETGFKGSTYSQIPSTLDEVIISPISTPQIRQYDVVFIIGATESNLPGSSTSEQILGKEDNELISKYLENEQFLPDTKEQWQNDASFQFYLGFSRANKSLVFSAPLVNTNDQVVDWSPFVKRIENFVQGKDQLIQASASPELETPDEIMPWIGTIQSTISDLVDVMREAINEQLELSSTWKFLIHRLLVRKNHLVRYLLSSLHYSNLPQKLDPQIAKALYGSNQLNTSISQLEEYNKNPFGYFLRYGLNLKERDIFELSAAGIGNFFHLAMDEGFKKLSDNNQTLKNVSNEEIWQLVQELTNEIITRPEFKIMTSSDRMLFRQEQFKDILNRVFLAIKFQEAHSAFKPKQTEVVFGQKPDGLKGIELALENENSVKVRGKIDRIDLISTEDQTFANVIDYKSSDHQFDYGDVQAGVALQMLTYLDVVRKNKEKISSSSIKPGGAFYFHFQKPKIAIKPTKTDFTKDLEDLVETKSQTALSYTGVVVNEPDLLASLDDELIADQKASSKLFKGLTKSAKGVLSSKQAVTEDQLELLLDFNEEKIKETAEQLLSGNISLFPVRWSQQKNALQYSPYKSIFMFDALMPGNRYNEIPKLSAKDFFESIQNEKEDNEDE